MRSRAETRVWLEHVLRAIVIVVLAVLFWQSFRETGSEDDTVSARGIVGALGEWSAFPKAPPGIHVQLDSVPSLIERAWLGALVGAGSGVTWSGDRPRVMVDAQPIASPTGGTTVVVAAPSGSPLVVSDEVGVIDTVAAQGTGVTLAITSTSNDFEARANGSAARTIQRDSVVLKKVLVVGTAGWESKFLVVALEEEGWKLDAFIRVAPAANVTQGSPAVIDTSRYAAVVALDDAASPFANGIMEFARAGGGVVLASAAASLKGMVGLRAGTIGRMPDGARALASVPLTVASLPLTPITSLRSDAVPLERRSGTVAIATRRIGAGRVLQVGYEETWRWRMSGHAGGALEHRRWWTELVSNVAYAPRVSHGGVAPSTDEAPMIGLVATVGLATERGDVPSLTEAAANWRVLLLALLTLLLIGEVASRRLRGAS